MGPATNSKERIGALIDAGMNVARLNFSHGSHEDHRAIFQLIRQVSAERGVPVAIMQDLSGPKIRTGTFEGGSVILEEGASFVFVTDEIVGDHTRCSTTYPELARDISVGDRLLLDDGLLLLECTATTDDEVHTVVRIGGELKNRKGINLPDTPLSLPSLTPKDRRDLEFGIELGVDFVALSFVRSGLDIHQLRCYLPTGREAPHIIAKIEKPQAVQHLEDIIAASDGIMIARGDLGVELPPERVPVIQKRALEMANQRGKLTITATQMLESMTHNARPTRAEASDVANAILDGSDAVMLSGETAVGQYPVETVEMMARIAVEAESAVFRETLLDAKKSDVVLSGPRAIARAATVAARELNLSTIACFTMSGSTPRLIKSYRPHRRVLALTPIPQTWRRMALYWGVEPVLIDMITNTDALIQLVEVTLRERSTVAEGEAVIIVMGHPAGVGSPTNMIKLHHLGEVADPHLNPAPRS